MTMYKNRFVGIALILLAIFIVLFAIGYGLVTNLLDLSTQMVAGAFLVIIGAGVSLLFRGWSSSTSRDEDQEPVPAQAVPMAPDLKIVNPRYRGGGMSHDVQESWSWILTVRNDGQRDGEIRNFHVGIGEIDPNNLGLSLDSQVYSGVINGIHTKEKAQLADISIRYANQNPTSYLIHAKVTKLVAELSWEKETSNGFVKDFLRLTLIPKPLAT